MSRKYVRIADLRSGTKVDSCYLLHNFQVRARKDGSNFVTLVLKDATGKITGVIWDNFDSLTSGAIAENDFVDVSGEVLTYNNQLQFKVSRIVKVKDSDVDASLFLPVSPVPLAELETSLRAAIDNVKDADFRGLLDRFFGNPAFMDRFRRAPSAVSMHQAYIGGLMEHTVCVARNAVRLADNYPAANKPLLLTAALLHDMGKIVEYVYDKKIAYADVGRLLGHISIGNAMVELECSRMREFPPSKKVLLQHIILSHHGLLEYGSPKRPKTLEALIVHHADQLDAQLSNYLEFATNAQRTGTRWEYSSMFERYIYSNSPDVEGGNLVAEIAARAPAGLEPPRDLFADAVPSDDIAPGIGEIDLLK